MSNFEIFEVMIPNADELSGLINWEGPLSFRPSDDDIVDKHSQYGSRGRTGARYQHKDKDIAAWVILIAYPNDHFDVTDQNMRGELPDGTVLFSSIYYSQCRENLTAIKCEASMLYKNIDVTVEMSFRDNPPVYDQTVFNSFVLTVDHYIADNLNLIP